MTIDIDIDRELLDDEGENRAVRSFLMQYGLPSLTVGAMRRHMVLSGWGAKYCPAFVNNSTATAGEHLTKAGAQIWIRHLFGMESRASIPPSTGDGGEQASQGLVIPPAAGPAGQHDAIYLVEAGIDYEGQSPLKAFATSEAAESFAAACRDFLKTAPPWMTGDETSEESDAWQRAEDAWQSTSPGGERLHRHIDYVNVTEIEFSAPVEQTTFRQVTGGSTNQEQCFQAAPAMKEKP